MTRWAFKTGVVLADSGDFSRFQSLRMALVSEPRVADTRRKWLEQGLLKK